MRLLKGRHYGPKIQANNSILNQAFQKTPPESSKAAPIRTYLDHLDVPHA
jgi:hypothetical protein